MPRRRRRSTSEVARRETSLRPTNRITRGVLSGLDPIRGVISRCGVDYPSFHALLATFLVLDERRGKRLGGGDAQPSSPFSGGFILTCIMNLVVGAMFGLLLPVLKGDPVLALGALLSAVLAFSTLVLVADYSAVLLDDTDVSIVSPLPLTDRTFFAARVAHIAIYVGLVLGSLALPGLLIGCFVFSPLVFVPVYLVTVALTACLALGLAFGFFLLALRFLDIERFKGAVLWVQMAVTAAFMGGLQLAPRLVDRGMLENGLRDHPWVAWTLPPCHQGGLLAMALGDFSWRNIGLGALAVALPLLALGTVVALASRGFLSGLGQMAVQSKRGSRPRYRSLGQQLLREPERRAGYDFCASLARRERQFRLRTYPLIAFALVMGVVFALREHRQSEAMLCGSIYLLGLYVPLFVIQARFSENWEARWILQVLPLRRPARFAGGANTAIALTLLLPMFLLLLAVVVAIGGAAVLVHAVFAAEAMLLFAGVSMLWLGRHMPFTEKLTKMGAQSSIGIFMLLGVVVMVAIGIHVALNEIPGALFAAMAILVPLLALTLRALARMDCRIEHWNG